MTLVRKCLLAITTLFAPLLLAHADTFTINGTGPLLSGPLRIEADSQGNGSYLINSITGPGDGYVGNLLIAPGGFNNNDNLIFPSDNPQLDAQGFSLHIQETLGIFNVNVFFNNGYSAFFTDVTPGDPPVSGTVPVSDFSLTPVPEPTALVLFGTGALGAFGFLRRRIATKQ